MIKFTYFWMALQFYLIFSLKEDNLSYFLQENWNKTRFCKASSEDGWKASGLHLCLVLNRPVYLISDDISLFSEGLVWLSLGKWLVRSDWFLAEAEFISLPSLHLGLSLSFRHVAVAGAESTALQEHARTRRKSKAELAMCPEITNFKLLSHGFCKNILRGLLHFLDASGQMHKIFSPL